jgi:DNA-binding GntR family transcriptional regulator
MLQRTPLRDEVYRHVLERVYTGHLPAGTRVKDTDIARDLGVSRTPVREALLRLAREGVLNADTGRGFQVPNLDGTEMRETGTVLSTLECLALECSQDIPPDRLARLGVIDRELAQTRGDADRSVALDEEWHRVLLEGCPNHRLQRMISTLWQVARRYMRGYLRDAGRVTLSTQHHSTIIEALRRNDRETARLRFAHHWQRGIEELGAWIER